MLPLLLAALVSSTAQASDIEPTLGLSAGPWFHSPMDDQGVSAVLVPRGSLWFGETFAAELDLAVGLGTRNDGGDPYLTFLPSVGVVASPWTDAPVQPLLELHGGAVRVSADGSDPVNLAYVSPGLGLLAPLSDRLDLRFDFRPQVRIGNLPLTETLGWWDFEALVGLQFHFGGGSSGPVDTDGDGIVDGKDDCPADAEDMDEIQDKDGCPETDADDDGVLDGDDSCPTVAADTEDGCPLKDSDGDGLVDGRDQCPDVPGTLRGCPDGDEDGVADGKDACPDEAAPGTADGCPSKARVTGNRIEIDEAVHFSSGGSVIQTDSYELLDQVVSILEAYPNIEQVEIAGHTDASGPEASNLKLSQARADAVKNYLVGKGVTADRLQSKGYGESTPIASNETPEGKAENRRVEFKIRASQ